MKTKAKKFIMFVGLLAILIIMCVAIIAFPKLAYKISDWTNTSVDTVRRTVLAVAGIALGLTLVSFGVGALAVPIVGGALIVVGLIIIAAAIWYSDWFGSSNAQVPIDNKSKLNKVA